MCVLLVFLSSKIKIHAIIRQTDHTQILCLLFQSKQQKNAIHVWIELPQICSLIFYDVFFLYFWVETIQEQYIMHSIKCVKLQQTLAKLQLFLDKSYWKAHIFPFKYFTRWWKSQFSTCTCVLFLYTICFCYKSEIAYVFLSYTNLLQKMLLWMNFVLANSDYAIFGIKKIVIKWKYLKCSCRMKCIQLLEPKNHI